MKIYTLVRGYIYCTICIALLSLICYYHTSYSNDLIANRSHCCVVIVFCGSYVVQDRSVN